MKNPFLNFPFLLLLTILIGTELNAQFKVDAQLRTRFELRDGYQKLAVAGSTPAAMVWQRTRISFSYESVLLKLKIAPQDVRLWGDEQLETTTGVFGDSAAFDLFEGFAEVKIGPLGWISVGRQQLVYDSKRLLGDRNWNNNGISYDAALLKLGFSDWKIHAGFSWNTLKEASSDNLYPTTRIKSLNFAWVNRKFSDNLNLSLLHIASGVTETDTANNINFRQTTGLYSDYKKGDFSAWGNAYYQYGKNRKGTSVSALLIDADANYKLGNFTPGLGFGYLSGNSKTGAEQTTDHLFDNLYGNRHRYFGLMDYFRTYSSHTKQGGLVDYFVYLDYKINKSLGIKNIGHYFQLAQTNPTTPSKKNLGYENDLVATYKFNDWGTLEAGYLFYLPTKTLKAIQGVADNKFSQFFYLQLTLTPTLFKQEAESKNL
jgi:hypothetical protein